MHIRVADETEARAKQEADLVRRLQARDPLAFRDLYDQFGAQVYSTALRVVCNFSAAEDVTQEIFLAIWTRIGTFDPTRGTLACWIGVMARNRAIDYLRSRNYRGAQSSASLEDAERVVHRSVRSISFLRVEQIRLLEGPWKRLKQHERRALGLAYYSGLSQSEIAQRLNRPLGTVKTWMRQGLQSLRAALEGANVH